MNVLSQIIYKMAQYPDFKIVGHGNGCISMSVGDIKFDGGALCVEETIVWGSTYLSEQYGRSDQTKIILNKIQQPD